MGQVGPGPQTQNPTINGLYLSTGPFRADALLRTHMTFGRVCMLFIFRWLDAQLGVQNHLGSCPGEQKPDATMMQMICGLQN